MGIEFEISPADARGSTPGQDQQAAGVGILLQIMMLVLSFVLGHVLRRHKFYYLPEASASLLIGICKYNISNFPAAFFFFNLVPFLLIRAFRKRFIWIVSNCNKQH